MQIVSANYPQIFSLFRCSYIIGKNGNPESFSSSAQDNLVRTVIEPLAKEGLRTISIAYKDIDDKSPNWDNEEKIISDLTCLCIVGIEDPGNFAIIQLLL